MFTVELNKKTYKVTQVPVRVLREMGPVQEVYKRLMSEDAQIDPAKDIDTLVRWFVLFCGEQFTADEVYDHYPGDRIITDVGLAMAAMNTSVEKVLSKFPTGQEAKKKAPTPSGTSLKGFIGNFLKRARAWRK